MYETSDLGFATTMVTLGYKIATVKTHGKQMMFCFDNNNNFMQDMSVKYMNDELSVPAKSFFNNIKTIKNVGRSE